VIENNKKDEVQDETKRIESEIKDTFEEQINTKSKQSKIKNLNQK